MAKLEYQGVSIECIQGNIADQPELKSIAFPAISTGIFGNPLEPAALIAVAAIMETIPELESIKHIRLVLF